MERTSQTKLMLADSLKDLMKKIPFCKITVQNVTEHCGLNRQTFYYHFKDMYDLLEWIYKNDLLNTVGGGKNQDWKTIMQSTIKYAKRNRAFLRNTNRSLRKETLEKFMYPAVSEWVELLFGDACGNAYMKRSDKEFILDFVTHAFIDSIIQWIGQGMQEDENALFKKVGIIRQMFKHCHTAPTPLMESRWRVAERVAK